MASSNSATLLSNSALTIYPYQRRWLEDDSRFKIGEMARQCGKTFTTTLEIVLDCLYAEAKGERRRWVILSRGERQAREAMEEGIKRHLAAFKVVFESLSIDWDPNNKALEVSLPGGSRITALPANADTARGFSASVLLDEFAFHQDSRRIWAALFPVISAPGLKIRVISTPNGKGNKFYDLISGTAKAGDRDVWSKHITDIYQAVSDGLPRDIEELKAGVADADAWGQEYELKWLDEASAWLSYELINSAEHPQAGLPEHTLSNACYVGVDIAIRGDLFVIWVLERVGDVLWSREIITGKRISFAEQAQLLDRVMRQYKPVRVCMDQTGMGEKPTEDAKRKYGAMRVEGLLFTQDTKQTLAIAGKQAFEDKRLRIPEGDGPLRDDLHKLRREVTATGASRFVADSDAQGHADRAWALFLAIHAAGQLSAVMNDFTPAPQDLGSRWHGWKSVNAEFDGEDDDLAEDTRQIWQMMQTP